MGRKGTSEKFPSIKLERMVSVQSLLEGDYLYHLEWDLNVLNYKEQPLTIKYKDDKKWRHYTPDFRVRKKHQTLIVEIKPQIFVCEEGNDIKWAAARQWCSENKATFQVVTDIDIRQGSRLENIKLLMDYARYTTSPQTKAHIFTRLHKNKTSLTIADLISSFSPDSYQAIRTCIFTMAFHHEIFIPMDDAPITTQSPVYLPANKPT